MHPGSPSHKKTNKSATQETLPVRPATSDLFTNCPLILGLGILDHTLSLCVNVREGCSFFCSWSFSIFGGSSPIFTHLVVIVRRCRRRPTLRATRTPAAGRVCLTHCTKHARGRDRRGRGRTRNRCSHQIWPFPPSSRRWWRGGRRRIGEERPQTRRRTMRLLRHRDRRGRDLPSREGSEPAIAPEGVRGPVRGLRRPLRRIVIIVMDQV